MVRSGWIFLAVLGAFIVQPDRLAHAAPAPYSDWAFDASRADEAQNLGAFGELVKKKPDFARVWFYGRIFDLTTQGIPDAEKVQLRSRLQLISDILGAAPYSDGLPKLLLDRSQNQTLQKMAVQSRELQQKWMAQMNRGDTLPLRLAVVQNPIQARIAFYVLMYRSELAVRRLGGSRDRLRLLAGSRVLAEGFALADGDLGPWKALSAFYGTNGLPGDVKGVVEQQVTAAINAYVQGKPAEAKASYSFL